MPTRRNTLIGLGILGAGGAGAVATGAFSAATAEREVQVGFADDDTQAILAFQPTSSYARLNDENNNELLVDFEDLNRSANFTFEDTFIIVNNGTETISLEGVGSGDDDNDWRNEESTAPVGVLIGENENEWQGAPNTNFIEDDEVDPEVETGEEGNTGGGYYDFDTDEFSSGDIVLEPRDDTEDSFGDWVSIGFKFGLDDDVGGWDPDDDIPDVLQFEFGQPS